VQIITDRLILNAATAEILKHELAFLRGQGECEQFARALGATVEEWPPLYHDDITCAWGLERVTNNPELLGWGQWHILLKRGDAPPLLVASAGFHGPPDAGNAEIGYSVIEPRQRQGIAPEIVTAFCKWAFDHDVISKLTITTLDKPELQPSSKVALRSGFHLAGTRPSHEGTILIYELSREGYTDRRARSEANVR
jgi:RimJ/RimL family protein N-acetyltransferase